MVAKQRGKGGKWADRAAPGVLSDLKNVTIVSKHLKLNLIDVDPEQPRFKMRKVGITPESITEHLAGSINLSDSANPKTAEAFEKLLGFAQSIKEHGLIHAVNVVPYEKDGSTRYRLTEGERRFLSHILNESDDIYAVIKPNTDTVKGRKAKQIIENIQRENLLPEELIAGIEALEEEHIKETGKPWDAKELAPYIGASQRQAQTYLDAARAPEEVKELVNLGKINNLDAVVKIAENGSESVRQKAIKKIKSSDEPCSLTKVHTMVKEIEESEAKKADGQGGKQPDKGGRPTTKVKLGETTNPAAVKSLIERYVGEQQFETDYQDINWSDLKAVTAAWKSFWANVEQEAGN